MKRKTSESQGDIYAGSNDEWAEARTVAARDPIRSKMQKDIEAFLAQGGQIQHIDPNLRADPPRKPTSNYGSQPI